MSAGRRSCNGRVHIGRKLAGRKIQKLDDYVVAGRNGSTLMIVGTLVASFLSTNTFLAESGMAYGVNAGGWILIPPICAAGYVYGARRSYVQRLKQ